MTSGARLISAGIFCKVALMIPSLASRPIAIVLTSGAFLAIGLLPVGAANAESERKQSGIIYFTGQIVEPPCDLSARYVRNKVEAACASSSASRPTSALTLEDGEKSNWPHATVSVSPVHGDRGLIGHVVTISHY